MSVIHCQDFKRFYGFFFWRKLVICVLICSIFICFVLLLFFILLFILKYFIFNFFSIFILFLFHFEYYFGIVLHSLTINPFGSCLFQSFCGSFVMYFVSSNQVSHLSKIVSIVFSFDVLDTTYVYVLVCMLWCYATEAFLTVSQPIKNFFVVFEFTMNSSTISPWLVQNWQLIQRLGMTNDKWYLNVGYIKRRIISIENEQFYRKS